MQKSNKDKREISPPHAMEYSPHVTFNFYFPVGKLIKKENM